MTGCDTTSALSYIEKKTMYDELCQEITTLATNDVDTTEDACRQFLFCLNDKKGKVKNNDLNEMRAKMCKVQENGNEIAMFPPCEAAFKQKMRRSILQSCKWYMSHIPLPVCGNPEEFGKKGKRSEALSNLF